MKAKKSNSHTYSPYFTLLEGKNPLGATIYHYDYREIYDFLLGNTDRDGKLIYPVTRLAESALLSRWFLTDLLHDFEYLGIVSSEKQPNGRTAWYLKYKTNRIDWDDETFKETLKILRNAAGRTPKDKAKKEKLINDGIL